MEGKIMFKKASKTIVCILVAVGVICISVLAEAKVTKEEAERLKKDLTPMGAERAGNVKGTIPAWDGGLIAVPKGISYKPGKPYPDPFAADKILFSITAQNMNNYADNLSAGTKAMLKKYPATYKLNVYQTRRTEAAPQWVYDNTSKNALRADVVETYSVTGAYGGIPFPIPKSGVEAIYNHLCRWQGPDYAEVTESYIIYPDGKRLITAGTYNEFGNTYYDKNGSLETWDGYLVKLLSFFTEPARQKGVVILSNSPLDYRGDSDRAAWQYMPGQRRVRRAPSIAYDTPMQAAGGNGNYDDLGMFNGQLDRFDWKLIGKKEIFIPYNCYQADLGSVEDVATPHHINPKYTRWELHRVWIVEATLRSDKRHNYGKRVMYIDEDSWQNTMMDNYDTRGSLWRIVVGLSRNAYDLPGILLRHQIYYDLQTDLYAVAGMIQKSIVFKNIPSENFTPQNVRKLGLR
jgi:hypothetical protein